MAEIVRVHSPAVWRIVHAHVGSSEAEDATQEVFLRVQQGIGAFEGESLLSTWIYRIATNVALNRLRRWRRKPRPDSLDGVDLSSSKADPVELACEREARRAFEAALATLAEDQRAVVVLRGVEGLSFEEIARALGIPKPTAESRMARARDRLRQLLQPFLDQQENASRERRSHE